MSTQQQSLFDAALLLPESERGELAARLMDTLDDDTESDLDEAEWAEELQRRIDEARSGAVATVPWEVVRQKMVDINNAAAG